MCIEKVVESLCCKYRTRNPFEIASCKNIDVSFLSLGEIRGYYSQCYRHKCIHINSELALEQQRFTCAHELAHAILHPNSNTPFLQTNTLFCVNRYENEANYFATSLIVPEDDLKEYESFSVPEIAAMYCIDERLIEHRLKMMKK
nr:ImmA/IrrE family metallo-endopeptidase [uncultured Caproiciproducens sp.]